MRIYYRNGAIHWPGCFRLKSKKKKTPNVEPPTPNEKRTEKEKNVGGGTGPILQGKRLPARVARLPLRFSGQLVPCL